MTFFTDDRLRQAAKEAGAILDGSLPAPEDCPHTFSLPFQAKMAKLLRRHKRAPARRAMRRVACLVLVCLLGSGVFLTTNAQAREAFFGWVSEQVESARRYFHVGDPLFSEKVVRYEIDVPAEYSLLEEESNADMFHQFYVNDSGEYIDFTYQYETENTGNEAFIGPKYRAKVCNRPWDLCGPLPISGRKRLQHHYLDRSLYRRPYRCHRILGRGCTDFPGRKRYPHRKINFFKKFLKPASQITSLVRYYG